MTIKSTTSDRPLTITSLLRHGADVHSVDKFDKKALRARYAEGGLVVQEVNRIKQ